jgi:ferritin-like metal-binding protein YciE
MPSDKGTQKLTQYLMEARATELALTRTLQAHIAITRSGNYRRALERHLRETREHAKRVERRAKELGYGRSVTEAGAGVVQGLVAQALALTKAPIEVLRGERGEERMLKNAKDECASEALEIATYAAIEELARSLGDDATAELAVDIRADEERVLEELRGFIPELVAGVVRAELEGVSSSSTTGAAHDARKVRGVARTKGAAGAAKGREQEPAKR